MVDITAFPFVPGQACGTVSRRPQSSGTILVLDSPALPDGAQPAGMIVVAAAPFSHSMLALLARGIPTVIVTAEQAARLPDGSRVELDGTKGRVHDAISSESFAPIEPVAPVAGETVLTRDGVAVALRASVRDAAGAAQARQRGAEAIGLLRSEFLLPSDGTIPDRPFYERSITAIANVAAPLVVTVRLLDIATDKCPAWLPPEFQAGRTLGLQGVRLYEREPVRGVVEAQIEALARLTPQWPLRVLLPYITSVDEAQYWRNRIAPRVPISFGVMAETPAAALDIGALLKQADFVALGTNDLMQCLYGADRDQPAVRGYLDPYAPVLYRFLADVAQAAGTDLARVQVCGLLSQLPGVLPLLLGLGYRTFSVDPVYLPWLAESVRTTRSLVAAVLAARVCHASNSTVVKELLGLGLDSSPLTPAQYRPRM
jgi:phosphoenolpyruvate-protein kinase (PTS system EI component)